MTTILISLQVPTTFRNSVLDSTSPEDNEFILNAGVQAFKMTKSSSATKGHEVAMKSGEEIGRRAMKVEVDLQIKSMQAELDKLQSRNSAYERERETLLTEKSFLEQKVRCANDEIASRSAEAKASQRKFDEDIIAQLNVRLLETDREKNKYKDAADTSYKAAVQTESARLENNLAQMKRMYEESIAKVDAELKEYKIKVEKLRKEKEDSENGLRKTSEVKMEALRNDSALKVEALRKEKEDSENVLRKASEAKEEALQMQMTELRKKLEVQAVRNAGSSTKGADAENEIALLLHTSLGMIPGYKMLEHKIRSGDHIVEFDKMTLMFETKDKATLKKTEDIDKVHRDMENHPECDAVVFISKVSEIPGHQRSSHFDVSTTTDGRPMIWVGKFDEKPDKVAYMQMVHLVVLELVKMARTLDKSSGVELLEFYKGKVATLRRYMKDTSSDLDGIVKQLKEYNSIQSIAFKKMEVEVKTIVAKFKQRLEDAMQDEEEMCSPAPMNSSAFVSSTVEAYSVVSTAQNCAPISVESIVKEDYFLDDDFYTTLIIKNKNHEQIKQFIDENYERHEHALIKTTTFRANIVSHLKELNDAKVKAFCDTYISEKYKPKNSIFIKGLKEKKNVL